MSKILIQNGRIIDPANNIDQSLPVYIAAGKIVSVGQKPADFTADITLDAQNKIVCPGFVDLSVRLREPGHSRKGSIHSETRAAAAAGVTSLCLPPDTRPIIDTPSVVEYIRDKAEQAGYPNVFPFAALTKQLKGQELSNMQALKRMGCIAVSNAMCAPQNLLILRHAMEYAVSHDLPLALHPDEPSLSRGGCLHEGAVASQYGLPGIPAAAETIAVTQTLELSILTGCRVHFSQISGQGAVKKIQQAQHEGLPVTADVAIHQLHLTDTDLTPFDSRYHVLPPFRGQLDKTALREGLINNTLTAICSDHQPHDLDAKLGALPETEPGISALETLLPLTLQLVAENSLSLSQAISRLTDKPAAIFSLNKGTLSPGMDADICIFDPNKNWQVNKDTWHSAGINTPYWEQTLQGKVSHTLQSGKIIYQDNV